jgi:hypothetical protein
MAIADIPILSMLRTMPRLGTSPAARPGRKRGRIPTRPESIMLGLLLLLLLVIGAMMGDRESVTGSTFHGRGFGEPGTCADGGP